MLGHGSPHGLLYINQFFEADDCIIDDSVLTNHLKNYYLGTMNWRNHIETDNHILLGKPVVKGTRISIEHIIKLFASGWTEDKILENYPRLTKENLLAVFAYIQDIMQDGLLFEKPLKTA